MSSADDVELMGCGQVAAFLCVDPKTVSRYGREGMLVTWPTLGGQRRYFGSEVRALARGEDREKARALALAERALLTERPVP